MLSEKLKEIGLTDKETSVYLCVLEYQKILPAKVSSLTGINRPTVYSVAKELAKKGLIAEDQAGKAKYLVSLGVKSLENFVNIKELNVRKLKQEVLEIISELNKLPKKGKYSVPKIRFIEEDRLKDFLINESHTWAKSVLDTDNTWWGFQDHTLLENYQGWADHFWNSFSKDITLNLLTNEKPIETEVMSKKPYKYQRNVKYWKDSSDFTATHVVAGDYILMIMTRERPHYLIEIHDRTMADNLRKLFKAVWKLI